MTLERASAFSYLSSGLAFEFRYINRLDPVFDVSRQMVLRSNYFFVIRFLTGVGLYFGLRRSTSRG